MNLMNNTFALINAQKINQIATQTKKFSQEAKNFEPKQKILTPSKNYSFNQTE